jgi:hypothetical protein
MLRRSSQAAVSALRRWPGQREQRRLAAAAAAAIVRDPSFGTVQSDDLEYFRTVVGGAGVETDPDKVAPHNEDWMRKYRGSGSVVLKPKSSEQVSQLLAYCSLKRLAVVPQVGGPCRCCPAIPVPLLPRCPAALLLPCCPPAPLLLRCPAAWLPGCRNAAALLEPPLAPLPPPG